MKKKKLKVVWTHNLHLRMDFNCHKFNYDQRTDRDYYYEKLILVVYLWNSESLMIKPKNVNILI